MALDPITAVLDIGGKLIDKFWPDETTKIQAKLDLYKAQQQGELTVMANETALALKQMEVNVEDAKSQHFFQYGWRPNIGWICGLGLGYQFLIYPILVAFVPKILPLDTSTLLTLLLGMLGLGAMRTKEKLSGV